MNYLNKKFEVTKEIHLPWIKFLDISYKFASVFIN